MAGVKGKSGRKHLGDESKVEVLRSTLIQAVLEDCEKNPKRKLFWAEKFVSRLMPQEVKGSGANGEFIFKVSSFRE